MIKRITDKKEADICDSLLNELIIDEGKYDSSIDKNFVVNDYFCHVIKNCENILLGCIEDNKIVGYLFLKKQNEGYLIDGLFVNTNYRRRGIAKSLIQEAIKISKENNALFLDINVMYNNEIAKSLYKSLNFNEFKLSLRNELNK
jgi:ribosomal protein S18 acetylase RimI-like enzyme